MNALPAPPIPADCDLTDFAYMPLLIARLRKSRAWLICKRKPHLAFYMINVWTAAWHALPSGSLEDDEDVLADLAMCDPDKWIKLRDDTMRHWVKHADGRLYHPVVTELVLSAWRDKLEQRWRSECGRIKKHNDRHGTTLRRPEFDEWLSLGCPQGQPLPINRDSEHCPEGQTGNVPRDNHALSPPYTGDVPRETDSKGSEVKVRDLENRDVGVTPAIAREAQAGDSGKGAVENIGKSKAKANGSGQKWDSMPWVTATAGTVDVHRRQGETDEQFRDRTYTAVQARVNAAAHAAGRRAKA